MTRIENRGMKQMNMIDEYQLDVCKKAIREFGEKNQIEKAFEELGELSMELFYMDGEKYIPENMIDEIADVIIMSRQLALIFGEAKVRERVKFKIDRLRIKLK